MSNSFAQFCANYDVKSDIKAESLNETIKMLHLELEECNNNLTLSKKNNEELTKKNEELTKKNEELTSNTWTIQSNLLYTQQKNKELISNLEYVTRHFAETKHELNRVYNATLVLEAETETLYCYAKNVTTILDTTRTNLGTALKNNTSPATRIFSKIYAESLMETHIRATEDPKAMYYLSMTVDPPKLSVPDENEAVITNIVENYDYDTLDEDNDAAMGSWA